MAIAAILEEMRHRSIPLRHCENFFPCWLSYTCIIMMGGAKIWFDSVRRWRQNLKPATVAPFTLRELRLFSHWTESVQGTGLMTRFASYRTTPSNRWSHLNPFRFGKRAGPVHYAPPLNWNSCSYLIALDLSGNVINVWNRPVFRVHWTWIITATARTVLCGVVFTCIYESNCLMSRRLLLHCAYLSSNN